MPSAPIPQDADYVIVGGGTAGCVLANRLSEDPACRVVLVEAGPDDRNPWVRIPAGVARLFTHPTLNWRYSTEPEEALYGRALYWPRGKLLGGTSSINGMTFVRGQPADYDHWAALADERWSWRAVLPYFRALEDAPFPASEWRGRGGPMRVRLIDYRHPLADAFIAAGEAVGLVRNDDYNGASPEGLGPSQVTMAAGRRVSAADAYLTPARHRPNLQVVTGALVEKIVFRERRAIGVALAGGDPPRTIRATREVLLCAGTIASPQLLMRSGIGDARILADLGIAPIQHLPAVGRNLQDHVRVQLVYRTREATFNREARGWRLARHATAYALRRRGLLTVTASQTNGFVRSSPAVARPDLQLVFRPASGDYRDGRFVFHDYQGVMAMVGLLRPASRGRVTLRSRNALDPPVIVAGHLSAGEDLPPLLAGLALLRRIFAAAPLAEHVLREEQPGAALQREAELVDYVKSNANSMFHAVGTCAMGRDESSVTAPDLCVRGVRGLRVVDCSVMPTLPSGNTCAPVLMLAEVAADTILGRRPRHGETVAESTS